MKKLVVGMFALLPLLFVGCSEEETVDPRDSSIGTYTGEFKYYELVGTSLTYYSDLDESGSFVVTKGSNANTILINLDGDVITGTKVTAASNGYGFDINNLNLSGISLSGYQGTTIAGVKYHGAFFTQDKKMTFYLQYTIDGVTTVLEVTGNLQ